MDRKEKVEKEFKEVLNSVTGISTSPIGDNFIELGKNGLPILSGKWESKLVKMDVELPQFSKMGTINESKTCKECKTEEVEDVNWNLEDLHININKLLVKPVLVPLVNSIIYTQEYFFNEIKRLEHYIKENENNINSVRQLANKGISDAGNAVRTINQVQDTINSNRSSYENRFRSIQENISSIVVTLNELNERLSNLEITITEMNTTPETE